MQDRPLTDELPEPELRIANRHIAIPEETVRAFCRSWHLSSFRFYGSIMRDDFRPDSDIDVMVEFCADARPSMFDLGTMQEELEALFSRKVDLADRRSVEQSENYIRKKGMLSGKPPVLRQQSYLLDMLISARHIQTIAGDKPPGCIDTDEMTFHALCFACHWLAVSAHRVDAPTRQKYPEVPWAVLLRAFDLFEEDLLHPDKSLIREITWEIVPHMIPLLVAIIPPEDEI